MHREKDQLEKKLEEMESGNGDRRSLDTLKIQDLEVENNKLREEMKKIRKSIAESSDVDNNEAVREMAEQYETLQVLFNQSMN